MKLPQFHLRDLFWLVLVVAIGCNSVEVSEDIDSVSLGDLQGTWELVSLTGDGEDAPDKTVRTAGFVMKIHGERFEVVNGTGKLYEAGKLVVRDEDIPVAVDQIVDDGADKNSTEPGIIRIRDGVLWWNEAHPGYERPADFVAPKGTHCTLSKFRRMP